MTASQRREMVLQAALIEFAAHGLDGTSTQDIAQRAGISQPYLFRLFPAKKALFLSVVKRSFQQVTQALATAATSHAGEDALQAMGSAFGQLCQQRTLPLMQLHAYAASTDPEIQAATRAAFQELRISVGQLTGLPPARVQQWFGTGMLMTATTAINLQAVDIPWHLPFQQPRPLGDPADLSRLLGPQCRHGLGAAGSHRMRVAEVLSASEGACGDAPFGREAEVLGQPAGGGGRLRAAAGPPWAGGESRDRGLRILAACAANVDGICYRKGAPEWPAM